MQRGGTRDTSNFIPSSYTALAGSRSWYISDYVIRLGGFAKTFDG